MAKFKIDFTGVEDGFTLLPEGDYICKVTKITVEQGDKAKYLKWELTVGLGENKGQKLFEITSLSAKALFRLRTMIMSLGIDVPKSAFSIDTEKYVGKILGVSVIHEDYEKDGKKKKTARVSDTWKAIKTSKGWGRAADGTTTSTKKATQAVEETEEEDEEVPFDTEESVNGVSEDGVEEIEI